jgi:hypothetical protein
MAGLIKRGKFYSATYTIGGKEYRRALRTTSYRVAKERLLQLEQTLLRGEDSAKPTRTPFGQNIRPKLKVHLYWIIQHVYAHGFDRFVTKGRTFFSQSVTTSRAGGLSKALKRGRGGFKNVSVTNPL